MAVSAHHKDKIILAVVAKRAQERAASSGRPVSFNEFTDILADEMIHAIGDPEAIGIDVFVGLAHGAIGTTVAAKRAAAAKSVAPSSAAVKADLPSVQSTAQAKRGDLERSEAKVRDLTEARDAARHTLNEGPQSSAPNDLRGGLDQAEQDLRIAEQHAAYQRASTSAWEGFAQAKHAFDAAVAAGHPLAEITRFNARQVAAYDKVRVADRLAQADRQSPGPGPIMHSMAALDAFAEAKRAASESALVRLKEATAARDKARAARDAAGGSTSGEALQKSEESLATAESDLRSAQFDATYFKDGAAAWTQFAQARRAVAEIEKATRKPLPPDDARKIRERASFAAAWRADHGPNAAVPPIESIIETGSAGRRPVSNARADAQSAETAPASTGKMLRPQRVVVLSPDLESVASNLLLPEHLQDATIIVGHGSPERLAGMEREKAVAFASANGKPGKPIVFVSCTLAARGKPAAARAVIPTGVAGTGKFPYVVAYSELVTVLNYDVGGFPKGSIVPIKERGDIAPAIQQGPAPDHARPGKHVRRLGNGQYIICDNNIIPVQKPIRPEDRGGPGIVTKADGTTVRVVMHEVVPTEKARRVYLPVLDNWATEQANAAHSEAEAARQQAHDHPPIADVYAALAKFYHAKARWYETSRGNAAKPSLNEVRQAHAELMAKVEAARQAAGSPNATELAGLSEVARYTAEWLREAETPGSTLPPARLVSDRTPNAGDRPPGAGDIAPVLAGRGRSGHEITASRTDNFASVRDQFLGGAAPRILNTKLAEGTHKLSVPGVGGIIYSEKTNTPIAVSQHLTAERIKAADQVTRSRTKFQNDLALPEGSQAVDAYAGYTDRFDRGHMIPAGESETQTLNAETFRNSNIVPQDVWHNERLWDGIQLAVRTMARNGHDLYVVTGPAFIGEKIDSITDDAGHRVLVPTHIWKAVYDQTTGEAAVYWTENKRGSERNAFRDSYRVLSIAEFARRTGIDPFPNLSAAQKQRPMRLPPPEAPRYRERSHDPQSELASVGNPVKRSFASTARPQAGIRGRSAEPARTAPGRGQPEQPNEIRPSKVDGFASVRDQLLDGVAPRILNGKLAEGTRRLSIPQVGAIIYSEKTNTPILAAQHLTPGRVAAAARVSRSSARFQDDPALPESARSTAAYGGHANRFDRGHLIPPGESPSQALNIETYRNSNMVPQDVSHNERLWNGIEAAVRRVARNGDDLYVITGPAFIGEKIDSISDGAGRRVLVPTHMWKAVYDKTTGEAAVYWTENRKGSESNQFSDSYEVISLAEFAKRTGIDPFPSLSEDQKQHAMELPPPETPRYEARNYDPQTKLTNVDNPVATDGAEQLRQAAPAGRPADHPDEIGHVTKIHPSKLDDFASVRDQFLGGAAPRVLNLKLARSSYDLSVPGVGGIIFSRTSNTPIAAAEHLTADRVNAADQVTRSKAKFQDDLALPESAHSVAAYAGYTDRFDHGHMIPAGDSPSQELNTATFRSSNIVPQDVWHNERLWEGIESAVRKMARDGDDLYVVTGPAFIGETIESISDDAGHHVLVPTHIWKAVYNQTTGKAAVYWTENQKGSESDHFRDSYEVLSIAEFTKRTGIDPFPKLSPDQKQHAMDLPPPEEPRFRERKHDPESDLTDIRNPIE